MFKEEDLIPLSSLQHYVFCPRQCALIHVEQQWDENRFTAEGRLQHLRVDQKDSEVRDGVRIEYGVSIRSFALGLVGKADAVEFFGNTPVPVEYKRGRPKPDRYDHVQLCGQAICLEEMLNVKIPSGAIFYGKPRRRELVEFKESLRAETTFAAKSVHELIKTTRTPAAKYDPKKCKACSLLGICMPSGKKHISNYLKDAME